MAKEIIVVCDACQDDGGRTTAKTSPMLTIGSLGPGTLDFCDDHRDMLLRPILELLQERGADADGKPLRRRPGRPPAAPTPRTLTDVVPPEGHFFCFLCEEMFATPSPYKGHFPRTHHMRMGEALGNICPVDGEVMANPTIANRHYLDHGVTYTGGLFLVAQSQGDPHGIVAERTAAVIKSEKAAAA